MNEEYRAKTEPCDYYMPPLTYNSTDPFSYKSTRLYNQDILASTFLSTIIKRRHCEMFWCD